MFDAITRRQEQRQARSDESTLAQVCEQGHDARARGLACIAPSGYETPSTLDLVGTWTAGWEAADREYNELGASLPGAPVERKLEVAAAAHADAKARHRWENNDRP